MVVGEGGVVVYEVRSVRNLAALVEKVAPRDRDEWETRQPVLVRRGSPRRDVWEQVSRSRANQLWMVVGMFDRAVQHPSMPERTRTRGMDQLFTWASLAAFWELAVPGELRARAEDRGKRLPVASQRMVRDCLAILARLGAPKRRLRLPKLPQASARAVTRPEQEQELLHYLLRLAAIGPAGGFVWQQRQADARVRALAVAGVAVDTRSRVSELAAIRMSDLGEGLKWVRVQRRPQNSSHLPVVVEELRLSRATREALGRWLEVRERLVAGLEGGRVEALWVRVAPYPLRAGEPAGLPLSDQVLREAYSRGVRSLNSVMAGEVGWEPLPASLESLRRAVTPVEEERVAQVPVGQPGRPRRASGAGSSHGTEGRYVHGGCRCAECCEAAAHARRSRRRERAGA
uniref:hypothetical protein n=1 Tax=Streptomyces sp. W75 TaxID=1170711 RepID=UPI001866D1EC|nr:hypothetical protein [Streptomyces sp. W75]